MMEGIFGAIFALLGWSAEPELTVIKSDLYTCPQITDALWLPSGQYPPNYSPFGEWQVAEWRKGEPICKAWVKR
jgi:hypothetical protein